MTMAHPREYESSSSGAQKSRRGLWSLALVAGLGLAACGYTPVYAPGGAARTLIGQVVPQAPITRDEFDFAGRIEELYGRAASGSYALNYTITTAETAQAIDTDNVTTRHVVTGEVTFRLVGSGVESLAEGRANAFTSYAATGTAVASEAARRDARQRLMRALADQVAARISAALAR